jgi:hypothetical protein
MIDLIVFVLELIEDDDEPRQTFAWRFASLG